MAKKIVNLRLSEEMIDLITAQIGDTFTQKFENLVTRCMWELPAREEQLAAVKEKINQERERLRKLEKASEELRCLEKDINSAKFYFGIVERRAKAIADATEEM